MLQRTKKINFGKYVVYIAFGFIFLIFSLTLFKDGFLSGYNLMNIGRQSTLIIILTIGMTLVLAAGEIDLSVGANVSLCSLVAAYSFRIQSGSWGIVLAIILSVLAGLIIGLVNGFFVAKLKVPSFLATLGMAGVVSGIARWISGLKAIPIPNDKFIYYFGGGNFFKIPILFGWALLFIIIGAVILYKIPLGKKILATGGNVTAAYFSGIKTQNIKWGVFLIVGFIAGFVGVLFAGRFGGGRYDIGDETQLTIIAATVLGGTSLFGGKASVYGAVIGALILGMLNNGLLLFGLDIPQQMIVRGVVIILAVAASRD